MCYRPMKDLIGPIQLFGFDYSKKCLSFPETYRGLSVVYQKSNIPSTKIYQGNSYY